MQEGSKLGWAKMDVDQVERTIEKSRNQVTTERLQPLSLSKLMVARLKITAVSGTLRLNSITVLFLRLFRSSAIICGRLKDFCNR